MSKDWWPIWVVATLFLLYVVAVVTGAWPFGPDSPRGGEFGDAFGALTSLFNGLAFAGLIITIRLQARELRLQRRELRLQREELRQTRSVLAQQEQQLNAQVEVARRQVFETTFFNLLSSLRAIVEGFRYGSNITGVGVFAQFINDLLNYESGRLRDGLLTPIEAEQVYRRWYEQREITLSSYFEIVLTILAFIDKSDRPDKALYGRILRATLSPAELGLLFHHGLGDESSNRLHLHIKRYALLRSFRPESVGMPATRRQWHSIGDPLPGAYE